ncbi:MAG: flagellar hook-basal body protein [Candidatus Hydrogenedentes bacterium]|nr:flagellar hook-basal body protein [Candidatus Hydrogenedentota bacterium]
MIQGLYAAATGMMALEERHNVIANNIANSATVGFKRQNPISQGFKELFLGETATAAQLNSKRGPGGGLKTLATFTDLQSGPIFTTDDPLNVALSGPGFIGVETPGGERYTRNGSFIVDVDGQLATQDGYKIQSAGGGAIDVGEGKVRIDDTGAVTVDGQLVGEIRIVEFQEPRLLEQEGGSLFFASEPVAAQATAATETRLIAGSLEASNVQAPVEMAEMMLGLRAYEANQRVITAVDETAGRLINDVGSPA